MTLESLRWTLALATLLFTGAALADPAAATGPESASVAQPVAATPGKVPPEPVFQSRRDKISYAFGADLGRDLKRQKKDLNVNLLMRALTDTLAGNKLMMTDDEVTATLKTYDAERAQDIEHAKTMIADKNRRAGEAFFNENLKKAGVVTLPSGLQYKVLKQGDGKLPTLNDYVVCNYRGTLLNGTEFDSSYKRNKPATVPVKGLIAGWSQALQLMPVGSKWQIFVPPQLAYGDKIVGGIGPNAMVVFEVELLSIQDKRPAASATGGS